MTTLIIVIALYCLIASYKSNFLPSRTTKTVIVNSSDEESINEIQPLESDISIIDLPSAKSKKIDPELNNEYYDKLFIKEVANIANMYSKSYKVPVPICIAQAILESDWGRSELSKKANNYFGVKKKSELLTERENELIIASVKKRTKEWKNGEYVTVTAEFNKYENLQGSVEHHHIFLNKRMGDKSTNYHPLLKIPLNDYKKWANALQKSGYATDPKYGEKLVNLIEKYKLYQYQEK